MDNNIILNRLDELEKTILTRLNEIQQQLDEINKSSKNMDEHINFIEITYENLKSPLNFIKSKVDNLMGKFSPPLEDKK